MNFAASTASSRISRHLFTPVFSPGAPNLVPKTPRKKFMKSFSKKTCVYSACISTLTALATSVGAAEFSLDNGVQAKVNATVTYGSTYRTEDPDAGLLGALSAARVPGAPAGQLGGNAGSSDLNFRKDSHVSTVLKGVADIELKKNNLGVFARAKLWRDFAMTEELGKITNILEAALLTAGEPVSLAQLSKLFDPPLESEVIRKLLSGQVVDHAQPALGLQAFDELAVVERRLREAGNEVHFADARERHKSVSHHSLTILRDICLVQTDVPVPSLEDDGERAGEIWNARSRFPYADEHIGREHSDFAHVEGENTACTVDQHNADSHHTIDKACR